MKEQRSDSVVQDFVEWRCITEPLLIMVDILLFLYEPLCVSLHAEVADYSCSGLSQNTRQPLNYIMHDNCGFQFTPFIFFMILGMKKENTNSPMEKKTLKDNSCPQSPETHTSLRVPIKKVKINVPTRIPSPVPKK